MGPAATAGDAGPEGREELRGAGACGPVAPWRDAVAGRPPAGPPAPGAAPEASGPRVPRVGVAAYEAAGLSSRVRGFLLEPGSPRRPGARVASAEAQPGRRPGRWLLALRRPWLLRAPAKFLSTRRRHGSRLQTRLLTDVGSQPGGVPCRAGQGTGNGARGDPLRCRPAPLPPAGSVPAASWLCREPPRVLLPPPRHPEATRPPRARRMPAGGTLAHPRPP